MLFLAGGSCDRGSESAGKCCQNKRLLLTNALQLLLQVLEGLLDGGTVRRGHVSAEHAKQPVQLLGQLEVGRGGKEEREEEKGTAT